MFDSMLFLSLQHVQSTENSQGASVSILTHSFLHKISFQLSDILSNMYAHMLKHIHLLLNEWC
jgi:hypothetical protein